MRIFTPNQYRKHFELKNFNQVALLWWIYRKNGKNLMKWAATVVCDKENQTILDNESNAINLRLE